MLLSKNECAIKVSGPATCISPEMRMSR